MKTCKECKHWSTPFERPITHAGYCKNPKMLVDAYAPPVDGIAVYRAQSIFPLMVGADFGCIHFDANEVKT